MRQYLITAGVPDLLGGEPLHDLALASLAESRRRIDGLLLHKAQVRLLRARAIADSMPWEAERLINVRPDRASWDIAPMLNVTGHGDNIRWAETPAGGRPVVGCWLDPDPQSAEYRDAVAACYWTGGKHHPRSREARRAWYLRNGGEHEAWRRGVTIDPAERVQRWSGEASGVAVQIVRCGDAWVITTQRSWFGIPVRGRYGSEVDNLFTVAGEQAWFPLPGYELRAPVTWSTLPGRETP